MTQVAAVLKKLHTSGIVMNNTFNVFEKIVEYERLLEEAGGIFFADYGPTRKSIMDLEQRIKDYHVPVVACHNDTVPSNFIKNYEGKVEDHYQSRLAIYKITQDLLWAIWALYKETQGEDFGDYALKRYTRAKRACLIFDSNHSLLL